MKVMEKLGSSSHQELLKTSVFSGEVTIPLLIIRMYLYNFYYDASCIKLTIDLYSLLFLFTNMYCDCF